MERFFLFSATKFLLKASSFTVYFGRFSKLQTSIKCAFLILAISFLASITSCKDNDQPSPDNNNIPGKPAETVKNTPGLKEEGNRNKFVLTSKDNVLVKVNPENGDHEEIFRFGDYDDVQSIDYMNIVAYVGVEDNSVNAINLETKGLIWDVPLLTYESTTLAEPKVVVDNGVAYACGVPGVLTAVDIQSGKIKWIYPLNPTGETSGYYSQVGRPTVAGDKIIIGTSRALLVEGEYNTLHIIDRNSGKNIWKKNLPSGFAISGQIKVVNDILLVPAHSLFAMNFATGNVLWEYKMEPLSRGAGTPVVAGDKVLVQGASAVANGQLYCINLKTGQKIWEVDAGNDFAGIYTPLIAGNYVFGVFERGSTMSETGNGKPFLANINTSEVVWINEDMSVSTSPVLANGRLFFHGSNFKLEGGIDDQVGFLSLEAATGKFLWLNNYFRYSASVTPIVVADNGIFRAGAYIQ